VKNQSLSPLAEEPISDAIVPGCMWRARSEREVTCIACGADVPRSQAREYDKYGDRWERQGKEFEYLCKGCYRECCHQPRDGLESMLVSADAGQADRAGFLSRFNELVTGDTGEEYEPGH
jgi:hypothetical protein